MRRAADIEMKINEVDAGDVANECSVYHFDRSSIICLCLFSACSFGWLFDLIFSLIFLFA